MKKSTTQPTDNQIALFAPSAFENVPAPELIARGGKGWEPFALQREHEGGALWAVQDWIVGISKSKRPRKLWDDMQRLHPELSGLVGQLPYTAKNGKSYDMDYADDTTLYKIVGFMNIDSILRDTVINLMAEAMHLADELRRDPAKLAELKRQQDIVAYQLNGKPGKWAESRVSTKISHEALVKTLTTTHADAPKEEHPNYGRTLGAQYLGLFDKAKAVIVEELGLTRKQADNIRDHLGFYALQALSLASDAASDRMESERRPLNNDEQRAIVIEAARLVAPAFKATAAFARRDFISGDPVDENGNRLRAMQTRLINGE